MYEERDRPLKVDNCHLVGVKLIHNIGVRVKVDFLISENIEIILIIKSLSYLE